MKLQAAATARNREPICQVLKRVLPAEGVVLEIASGTGEHAVYFSRELPSLIWQPSDREARHRESIRAWAREAALPNLREPLDLDVTLGNWGVDRVAAVVCINMIHIAPWDACLALFDGAAARLDMAAPLILYGPFVVPGKETAPSNLEFDRYLRGSNPSWGVRDLGEVTEAAACAGFRREDVVAMPANNLTVVFRRVASGH